MTNKYGTILILQMAMLLLDLVFNTAATVFNNDDTLQLMIFILQDATIIMCIIVMVIAFSSTFVFQAGLISLLLMKFSPAIILSLLYLLLSILLHCFTLRQRWYYSEENRWTYPLMAMFITQRLSKYNAHIF
uniref:Transmembrane protein 138 n=1 Tax=Ascaris lumbricoides TaxID=6252 RepID=A0A0M3IQJ4_ASCLU